MERIAEKLLVYETLSGAEVKTIMEGGEIERKPPVNPVIKTTEQKEEEMRLAAEAKNEVKNEIKNETVNSEGNDTADVTASVDELHSADEAASISTSDFSLEEDAKVNASDLANADSAEDPSNETGDDSPKKSVDTEA
jgi:hypothetical protein